MSLSQPYIVVVDDDNQMREMVKDHLQAKNYKVDVFSDPQEAFHKLSDSQYCQKVDLLITDMKMPNMSGIDLIKNLKRLNFSAPIILITAFATIENAVEATRSGAFDFITKPFKLKEFQLVVERALMFSSLSKENASLKNQLNGQKPNSTIIGKSSAMMKLSDLIQRVAKVNSNVLIQGESGTGKELVAKEIHRLSSRASAPFLAINCSAIPSQLLESELFGHVKGSFTGAVTTRKGLFEEAQGGTVFLDEIGDMDFELQAKILRVLQEKKIKMVGDSIEKPVNVRVIAATHRNLKDATKDGSFREDLFFRLSVLPVQIPPLRERKEDIPLLIRHFIEKYCKENSMDSKTMNASTLQSMMDMDWEGNVRELENLVERMVVMSPESEIKISDLPQENIPKFDKVLIEATETWPTLEDLERKYIGLVLEKTHGRKEKASKILGINRRTLYRKEREYGFVESAAGTSEQVESV